MDVLFLGDPLLRQKSLWVETVNQEIKEFIADMFVTMEKENGTGLAAPQVGRLLRIFVTRADDNVNRVFINPQIIGTSMETVPFEEGCLSIPNYYEEIIRPEQVTVQAINEQGKPFTLEAHGLLARVIQHEYDHLEGILYIDRGQPEFKKKMEELFERRARRRQEKAAKKKIKIIGSKE